MDAAYGGFALLTADGKEKLEGINRADSIGIDAHKWFFQPFEAVALIVKNGQHLNDAFAIRHDALQDTIWGATTPISRIAAYNKPFASSLKNLDVRADFWHSSVPCSDPARVGFSKPRSNLCRVEPSSGVDYTGVPGDCVF